VPCLTTHSGRAGPSHDRKRHPKAALWIFPSRTHLRSKCPAFTAVRSAGDKPEPWPSGLLNRRFVKRSQDVVSHLDMRVADDRDEPMQIRWRNPKCIVFELLDGSVAIDVI
jgi:hypothetical protein